MRTLLLVVVAALAHAGSSCKKKTGAASFTAQPIGAPFTELALPTEGGVVWFCHEKTIHVIYDGGDPKALGSKYEAALLAHGWVWRGKVDTVNWQWQSAYDKDKQSVSLWVEKADFSGKVPGGEQISLSMAP